MINLNKNISILALVSTLVALAAGCQTDSGTSSGGTYCGPTSIQFTNNAPDQVIINISGPTPDTIYLNSGETRVQSLAAGSYEIQATNSVTNQLLQDTTPYFGCGQAMSYDSIDSNPELDLTNSTADDLWIYIDGELQNELLAGDSAAYFMTPGNHQIRVEEVGSGYVLWDDQASGTSTYYGLNTITPVTLTADDDVDPIISLENDGPLGSDCLTSAVAYNSTAGQSAFQAIQFDDGTGTVYNEVCPGEIGYFAVTQGNWTMDFEDQQTSSSIYQVTQDFYNNTTTPFAF